MPYIPYLGTDGRARDVVHASVHDVLLRSLRLVDSASSNDPSIEMRGLDDYNSINTTALYAMSQQRTRQIVATTSSSLSLASALIAVYWFFMMRRNFRRDLVLLLILGGSFKSLWFVVFSVYSFVHGVVETETSFCQANGYLLQVGFEQCDAAVLFMSMHMYFQIFPTVRFGLGHDGLYRVRKWVYAAWIIWPNLSAALAFVNPRSAFNNLGGFCSLPLRPFWYRIALFWGPRYLIWCYVSFVAIRIYRYVGSEFKVFGQERDRSDSLGVPGNSSVDRMVKSEIERNNKRRQSQRLSSFVLGGDNGADDADDEEVGCAPDDMHRATIVRSETAPATESPKIDLANYAHRQSTSNWPIETDNSTNSKDSTLPPPPSLTYPTSHRGSQQIGNGITAEDFAPPTIMDPNGHRGSVTSVGSKLSSAGGSFHTRAGLPSITEGKGSAPVSMEESRPTASGAMKLRRRLIQRQLRLLFIYPCIYMLLWVIPLVINIMNYTDYFAQHPIFSIGLLQLVCVTIMTFADVVVFCWRERPWRHIPGADGTFVGSFMFWRYCFGSTWIQDRRQSRVPSYIPEAEDENVGSRLLSSLKKWTLSRKQSTARSSNASRPTTHKRTFSRGSDRKEMEAERAHDRLALERAAYEANRRSLNERRLSAISQQHSAPEKGRKEWFDGQGDLFVDQDLDVDEKL